MSGQNERKRIWSEPEFGSFLRGEMRARGIDDAALAALSGYRVETIRNILDGGFVSENLVLRVLAGLVLTRKEHLEFINQGLAAAGFLPLGGASRGPSTSLGSAAWPRSRSFGEFFTRAVDIFDLSETRAAQLVGSDTSTISKTLKGAAEQASPGLSEARCLRSLLGVLHLATEILHVLSRGLIAAGYRPFPIPGRDIPSHEAHARRKRGGRRGQHFGRPS